MQAQGPAYAAEQEVSNLKEVLEANMKKKKTLQTMSELLLKKNADLYLKHELMLDEERQKRMDLGNEFQAKMAVIQEELNAEKEQRNKQLEENNAIRAKIQDAIKEYNVKEQDYQAKMQMYQGEMSSLEKKFKSQIEGKVQTQLNKAKDAKDKYERAAGSVDDLATQIKAIVEKFDRIKDEIGQSSKRMEEYKESVEQNNLEIALLETEIKNLELKADKKRALQEEISVEGGKLRK